MRPYETPMIEVIIFDPEDVIITSGVLFNKEEPGFPRWLPERSGIFIESCLVL